MSSPLSQDRLHAFDAVRAFALLMGVVFHAGFSFIPGMIPGIWAMVDRSPSVALSGMLFALHMFRMSLFFFVSGFFARMLFHRKGARGFWANRSKRILVPFIAGWVILFPALAVVWVWGLTKTFGGNIPAPPANLPPPPPLAFPLTHLWFLYYLLVLYVVMLLGRTAFVALDRHGSLRRAIDTGLHAIVSTRLAAVLVPLPLIVALYFRQTWFAWFGIPTPDQSLIPELASMIGYGSAMTLGWLVHRQIDLLGLWRRQWPVHLIGAVIATAVCLWIAGLVPTLVPAVPGRRTLVFAILYGVAIWCWTLTIVGLAMRFMANSHPAVRYVSDASYWIYLVHLPIVAAFQVLVGQASVHWTLKFPFILTASLAVLFISYHYLVRSTPIGRLLNGRKYPRSSLLAAVRAEEQPRIAAGPETTPQDRGPMAALEGVRKRYGTTEALAGLDLAVHPGELLAVLGPNGAGKSTAISLWLGLLEPDAGSVQLLGGSPLDVESRRHVGIMMQEVGLQPELRVRELIELTASYYADPLPTGDLLTLTGTSALADRTYVKLSSGQKRQVQFALAICGRPRLLFLDEPTVGLDVEARETMWRTIRLLIAQGGTIVLTTHYLEEAEALADRVAVLASGRLIACGTVDAIRSVVSRTHIHCNSAVSAEDVLGWPGVTSVKSDGRRLQIVAVEAEAVVRRLLAADDHIRDLEVRPAGLAEAFTELTKEAA
jgi:ABC-type multidrug transport system ATPase subunit/peptidoglycan/LPS O-acetylase OafA/YrhL